MYSIKSVKAAQETLEAIEQFPHDLLALDVLNHQLNSFSCLLQFIMSSRSLCCFFFFLSRTDLKSSLSRLRNPEDILELQGRL